MEPATVSPRNSLLNVPLRESTPRSLKGRAFSVGSFKSGGLAGCQQSRSSQLLRQRHPLAARARSASAASLLLGANASNDGKERTASPAPQSFGPRLVQSSSGVLPQSNGRRSPRENAAQSHQSPPKRWASPRDALRGADDSPKPGISLGRRALHEKARAASQASQPSHCTSPRDSLAKKARGEGKISGDAVMNCPTQTQVKLKFDQKMIKCPVQVQTKIKCEQKAVDAAGFTPKAVERADTPVSSATKLGTEDRLREELARAHTENARLQAELLRERRRASVGIELIRAADAARQRRGSGIAPWACEVRGKALESWWGLDGPKELLEFARALDAVQPSFARAAQSASSFEHWQTTLGQLKLLIPEVLAGGNTNCNDDSGSTPSAHSSHAGPIFSSSDSPESAYDTRALRNLIAQRDEAMEGWREALRHAKRALEQLNFDSLQLVSKIDIREFGSDSNTDEQLSDTPRCCGVTLARMMEAARDAMSTWRKQTRAWEHECGLRLPGAMQSLEESAEQARIQFFAMAAWSDEQAWENSLQQLEASFLGWRNVLSGVAKAYPQKSQDIAVHAVVKLAILLEQVVADAWVQRHGVLSDCSRIEAVDAARLDVSNCRSKIRVAETDVKHLRRNVDITWAEQEKLRLELQHAEEDYESDSSDCILVQKRNAFRIVEQRVTELRGELQRNQRDLHDNVLELDRMRNIFPELGLELRFLSAGRCRTQESLMAACWNLHDADCASLQSIIVDRRLKDYDVADGFSGAQKRRHLVHARHAHRECVLKCINLADVSCQDEYNVHSLAKEIELYMNRRSPYIIELQCAFIDLDVKAAFLQFPKMACHIGNAQVASVVKLVALARDCCVAVAFLHQDPLDDAIGVIHGAIKPQNILLDTTKFVPVLCDINCGRQLPDADSLTFVAPELRTSCGRTKGKAVPPTKYGDIFGLGRTLEVLFSGHSGLYDHSDEFVLNVCRLFQQMHSTSAQDRPSADKVAQDLAFMQQENGKATPTPRSSLKLTSATTTPKGSSIPTQTSNTATELLGTCETQLARQRGALDVELHDLDCREQALRVRSAAASGEGDIQYFEQEWRDLQILQERHEAKRNELKCQETTLKLEWDKVKLVAHDPPKYWSWCGVLQDPVAAPRSVRSRYMDTRVKKILEITGCQPSGCSYSAASGPSRCQKRIESVNVWRLERPALWQLYRNRADAMAEHGQLGCVQSKLVHPDITHHDCLDTNVNEVMLWHGAEAEVTDIIKHRSCDKEEVKDGVDSVYADGCFFTSAPCKAGQYAPEGKGGARYLLYCRVLLGLPYHASGHATSSTPCALQRHNQRLPVPTPPGIRFDSVVVTHPLLGRGSLTHRDFIVYDRTQVYPEFLVKIKEAD